MGFRKIVRLHLIDKFPRKYQLQIERLYLYYFVRNYVETDVRILRQLCNSRKISLDVGANQGVFTLFLSKYSSHVYCFEPVPWLGEYLRNKYKGCNVSVINCALGDMGSEMYLNIPSVGNMKYETRSSLISQFENDYIEGKRVTNIEKIKVAVKKLDDFRISNIGLVKIDVEGFEYQVLKGGEETILQNRPVIFIEIEQKHHKKNDIQEIFNYLHNMDYLGYFFHNKELKKISEFDVRLMQIQSNEKTDQYINNFIFSPDPISHLKI